MMIRTAIVADLALEWMCGHGERTTTRLRGLVEHFANNRGMHAAAIDSAFEQAMTKARRCPGFTDV